MMDDPGPTELEYGPYSSRPRPRSSWLPSEVNLGIDRRAGGDSIIGCLDAILTVVPTPEKIFLTPFRTFSDWGLRGLESDGGSDVTGKGASGTHPTELRTRSSRKRGAVESS